MSKNNEFKKITEMELEIYYLSFGIMSNLAYSKKPEASILKKAFVLQELMDFLRNVKNPLEFKAFLDSSLKKHKLKIEDDDIFFNQINRILEE